MYDPIAARRAELQRTIAEAQRALDTVALVPQTDDYPSGTVVRAQIRYGSGDAATYIFLKVEGEYTTNQTRGQFGTVRWYHTGTISHSGNIGVRAAGAPYFVSWHELQTWLIDRGRVVESWEILEPELDHVQPWKDGDSMPIITGYAEDLDRTAIVAMATYRSGHWELNRALTDPPKRLAVHVPGTNDTFIVAWNDLNKRWESQ